VHVYLLFYFLVSLVWSVIINIELLTHTWNPLVIVIGGIVGLLNVGLMLLTSKALQNGPSGLTFAFQNAGSVFPNLILYLIFGPAFGFIVTPYQILGMSLVLLGLFLAALRNANQSATISKTWIWYALGCFLAQTAILTIFQWRCLLFCPENNHILIPFAIPEGDDAWFMPGFFATALFFQSFAFWLNRTPLQRGVVVYGCLSGVANASSTFLLLMATKLALPLERGFIFPLFAVAVIILCNIWGYKLYQERVDMRAILLCSLGILIASFTAW